MTTYGGDLFTSGHAWRNDQPLGEEPDWYCKWCGKKITGPAFARPERCPGK